MNSKKEPYSEDIKHAWTVLEERMKNGVHITVQPTVQGYKVHWYNYEEIFCEKVSEGICIIALLSLLD